MKKEKVLARMKEDCLVAVVRAKNYEQGEKVVDAIIAGGINFIELTMTMDEDVYKRQVVALAAVVDLHYPVHLCVLFGHEQHERGLVL